VRCHASCCALHETRVHSRAVVPPATRLPCLLQAFSLFSLIIDRLQEEVRPFVAGIMQLLPELWSDADGQPLMRIQVQMLMTHTCTACLPQRHLRLSMSVLMTSVTKC
jgi:hypothetical protein